MSFQSFQLSPPPFEAPTFESLFATTFQRPFLSSPRIESQHSTSNSTSQPSFPDIPSHSNPSHVHEGTGLYKFHLDCPPEIPNPPGSLGSDLSARKYTDKWETWEEFKEWLKREQAQKTVEFWLSKSVKGGLHFKETFYYVCSRRGTGGAKVYEKKHPDWT